MTQPIYEAEITRLSTLIKESSFSIALTGAGISTRSGIPDFRSQEKGLWMKDNPMDVISLSAFKATPDRFFDWLRPLVKSISQAQPNAAHYALADLERKGKIQVVVTQNIDSLHQHAGSQQVLELHGTLTTLTCPGCKEQYEQDLFLTSFVEENLNPICPICRTILKPDIVLYEEQLPASVWTASEIACEMAQLMLVIGTSLEVYPAASLPMTLFKHHGKLAIINLSPTPLDARADVVIHADAAEILPQIIK
ncbi:MAG TPA: NAD-dependent deacylase, partial [Longilinea sp.]|nr:NAD-dependent deacylase [Longilinea sp.]